MKNHDNTILAKKEPHIIEWLLPFFSLLAQYKIGVLSLGIIFLFIVAMILLFVRNGKFSLPYYYRPFLCFFGYVILRDILRAVLGADSFQTQLNRMTEYLVMIFLVLVVCTQPFDEDKLYKIWKMAGILYIIGIIYHVVQIYILGQRIIPISIIPGYVLRPEEAVAGLRPSSFFAEPASFVTAMLPLEFMALRRKDLKVAIIATISILLSTSTVGVILSIVLWTLIIMEKSTSLRNKLVIIMIAVVIIGIVLNLEVFESTMNKFFAVAGGGSTVGSRIICGIEVIKTESGFSLIVGTNYNDVNQYIGNNLSKFAADSLAVHGYYNIGIFLNTIARLIFMYGGIGLVLFLYSFIFFIRKREKVSPARDYIIMIIIGTFAQTMLLNSAYFGVVILVLLYAQISTEST